MIKTRWQATAGSIEGMDAHLFHRKGDDLSWRNLHCELVLNESTGQRFAVRETRRCGACATDEVLYDEDRILIPETQNDIEFLNLALEKTENRMELTIEYLVAAHSIDSELAPSVSDGRVEWFVELKRPNW